MQNITEKLGLKMAQDLELRLTSNHFIDHILNGLDAEALVIENMNKIRIVDTKILYVFFNFFTKHIIYLLI